MENSKLVIPVRLPPGRARLATNPAATGSTTCTNRIGMVRVSARTASTAGVLEATIARYNEFCTRGSDDDFHRGETVWEQFKAGGPKNALGSVEEAPFFAMPLNRSILGTKGGARTNAKGQVLRPDGSVIAGLYAAGLSMANPIGTRAVGPGTTIGPNLTWGFICGSTLLSDNRR